MRYKDLDYAKGLAILLMVFTHTMSGANWMSTWVFSFHMPIFFVICGILLEEKYAGHVTAHQVAALVRRRMVQIGVPYLVFGSALALFYSLLNVIAGQPVTMLRRMWELLTLQGIDSLWFLPCYVLAEFLSAAVRMRDSRAMQFGRKLLLAAAVVLLCLLAGNMPTDWRLRVLLKSLTGWVFVEVGISLTRHHIMKIIPIWGGNCPVGDRRCIVRIQRLLCDWITAVSESGAVFCQRGDDQHGDTGALQVCGDSAHGASEMAGAVWPQHDRRGMHQQFAD